MEVPDRVPRAVAGASGFDRRRFLTGSVGVGAAGLLAACTGDDNASPTPPGDDDSVVATAVAAPGSAGLVDEGRWQTRIDEYLEVATTELDPTSRASVTAHLARSHRDPDYVWDIESVTYESFQWVWDKLDNWEDTRDFRFIELHWLLALADGATAMRTLDPAIIEAAEARMASNRWQYDDPLPDGVIDNQWFWSENHIVIGAAGEYLAGRRLPDTAFEITGMTGAEHAERSREKILTWIDERARFGFFEFHSTTYMTHNIKPLLMLAELADDEELVQAATMAVDLCLLDIAAHTHRGSYTAPRGRTYWNDKTAATDENTFVVSKFLFDTATLPYPDGADDLTAQLCAAERYRPPQALVDIANTPGTSLVRERHGIFVDGSAPVTENPEAPFGYDFSDPANLEFWWSQGGVGLWQVAEVGLEQAERFRIFETDAMQEIQLLVALNGNDPERLRQFLQEHHAILNFGHLQQANTYHWRNDEVALASVVDHRFGQMRDQVHIWQATIDEQAVVFTTHPLTEPVESTEWGRDGKPGYWTGDASMPRTAQHGRTAIHIYQPAWDETTSPLLWGVFPYRPYTHAYFPQDRFDEVVQEGNWTFGRKGDGYVALYSWREPTWREYDPEVYATDGMERPFDLVADGGPDNVWVVEVGDAGQTGFAEWVAERVGSPVDVVRDDTGFAVEWASPASGVLSFGSTGPLNVDGVEQAIADFPRHESPWGVVDPQATVYALETEGSSVTLDFDAMTREHM